LSGLEPSLSFHRIEVHRTRTITGRLVSVTGWIGIAAGVLLLGLVLSDRNKIRQAWRAPARWWRPNEYIESREPSQPLNVILGLVLGIAALAFGVATLVS